MKGSGVIAQGRQVHRRRKQRSGPRTDLRIVCAVVFLLGMTWLAQADPDLPTIPTNTYNILNYGAYGNGSSNNAAAISNAIAAASNAGGGTVEIPSNGTLNTYWSGPITLKSSVNLQIDAGAMLQMLPMSSWPNSSTPFIFGSSLHDCELSGGGTIDGQGSQWWGSGSRPNFIEYDHTVRILIQGVTIQNPPTFTIYMKNSDGNVTIQNIRIDTPVSPNTDGMDISSTNMVIRNCYISDGDDNLEIGGNGAPANNITVSNCTFGIGHGVSIGSDTEGGVSNLVVSNCVWVGTEYGIKGKSDTDRGGVIQNCKYVDLVMSNVNFAFAFYSTYNTVGSPSSSFGYTPGNAATLSDSGSHVPIFENITVSNLTAYTIGGNVAGWLWGLTNACITNFTLCKVNILAPNKTVCMYNVRNLKIIDSNLTAPNSTTNTFTLYNAQFSITNSTPNPNTMTFTGLGTPRNSTLSLFNGQVETIDATVLGTNPVLTLSGSTLTVSNNATFGASSTFNYGLGMNVTKTVVAGNLTLGGTLNLTDAGGFGNCTYRLFDYSGALTYNGLTIGTVPNGSFTYAVSTNTPGQVNLIVSSSCSVGAAGPISGPSSVVPSTNGVTYSISGVSGATTYNWTVPSGATIASGQGTTTITVNYGCSAVSGSVQVTPSNGSCDGTCNSLAVNVASVFPAVWMRGPSAVAAGTNGVSYSIYSVSGATTYSWTVPSGASIASGQGTTNITVNYSCAASSGNVQVTPSNGSCNGTSTNLTVSVISVGAAGPITGTGSVNTGTNGVTYSISGVSGATTYTWTVPSGASIASGQGTTSITVNYSCAAGSGNVQVTPANANGCTGTSSSLSVTVTGVGPAGSVSGPNAVATGTNSVTYSISSVSGATTYTWTVPSGASIASGQGTTSITVNYSCLAASGNVQVTPSNGSCNGSSSSLPVTVTGVGAAGNISGLGTVCVGQMGVGYSISSVSGATTYNWTVPSGASVTSGQGTTSITVNWGSTSGNVTVSPANANGCTGNSSSLSVTVISVGPAGPVSGPNSVATGTNGVTYSISSVSGATTYTWIAPSGASITSGQGTTSITVNYSCSAASGNVQVTPSNGSCNGSSGSLGVTVTGVGDAGTISGSGTICAGQMGVGYSISAVGGATSYMWTVPSGASVASGQGTTSIIVNWGSSSGNVTVIPANANGCTGNSSSLSVTVNPSPLVFNVTGGNRCSSSGGGVVGLDGSQMGVNYQLLLGGAPTNAPVAGTGNAISFGNQTAAGTYTVAASDATTGCTNDMNGSASVLVATDPFECWQLQYFGCTNCPQAAGDADPFGKGMSNTNQFLTGLNPTNTASLFRIISVAPQGSDVLLTWTAGAGRTNAVQASQGDANGGYTNIFGDVSGSVILPGNNADVTTNFVDGGGATNNPSRFYRIRLVP